MFIKQLSVGPLGTNCYLLAAGAAGDAAVIDPGGEAEVILAAAREQGLKIRCVLLTHGHFDHTGAVADLRAALPGLPVYLHPADRALLGDMLMPAIGETRDYSEGDRIRVGALDVAVLHTPGHTPGGVTLMVEDVLFTGDTLFAGSMGRTDFAGGDEGAIMASLKRLGALERDFRVLPGHMEGSTLDRERRYNPCLREAMDL